MSRAARALLGREGEQLAARHLEQHGFTVVGRNVQVGRLELDLVAERDALVVFCEVRTRRSSAFVDPIETIDHKKQQRIRQAARLWLARHGREDREVRFDAASIVIDARGERLTYYESAF